MKSLMMFLNEVIRETGDWCHVSTSRDLKTIATRVEGEGLPFITITLPTFGKDFERSLDQGFVDPSLFFGFPRKGETPVFLGGFMDLVFDRQTGKLVDNPNITAIRGIRQITLMCSKIKLPLSEKRKAAAFEGFVNCERELKAMEAFPENRLFGFRQTASALLSSVFGWVSADIYNERILPKHGPGSTAERLLGNQKYNQFEWPERLEAVFPSSKFLSNRWISPEATDNVIKFIEPGAERPVRVVGVPKTQKTLRIISIEPTCMQYVQQGLMESFVDGIANDKLVNSIMGYKSQIPNQELALEGSITGDLATLDLSEASDRVLWTLVQEMFHANPLLLEAVDACRSRTATVPGMEGVIPLAKFASMGSALTFPIEAMVFMTIVMNAICDESNFGERLSHADLTRLAKRVRIYGDDIIVPVEYVDSVISDLEYFGLKVNKSKSFWTGKFRESCGKEYYDGHDVTLARVRTDIPSSRKHAQEIISTVSLRNQLYERGYRDSVQWLDNLISGLIPFPEVGPLSPALGRHTYGPLETSSGDYRWDPNLQQLMVKAVVVKVRKRRDKLDGYGALMKFFLKRGINPNFDPEHLMYAGRPEAVDIKPRWTTAR